MIFRRSYFLIIFFCIVLVQSEAQPVTPAFTFTDSICPGRTVNITNGTTGGTTFEWNFCSTNFNQPPNAQNLGNFSGQLDQPVFMDIVFTNNNYYGFLTNYASGDLIRFDFGNSLLNTPTSVNLGDFNGVIPSDGAGGIQVVQNAGNWYVIIVAGYPPGGKNPKVITINFGANITNLNPVARDWGNLGNMYEPFELVVLQEGTRWIGFTVNGEHNNITRIDFGTSFDTQPTGTSLGNIGNLSEPSGLYFTKDGSDWIAFVTNAGDNTRTGGHFTITRLNFGPSLLNTPTGINIGNAGNSLEHPRDIVLASNCDQIFAFIPNGHPYYNSLLRLNFNSDINTTTPRGKSFGTTGDLDYPFSITDFFSIGDQLIAFIVNKGNNSITRVVFGQCSNSTIQTSTDRDPPPISYDQAGFYNIQLTVDKGLPTEASLCRELEIADCAVLQELDSIIIINDTTICAGSPLQIRTYHGYDFKWRPPTFLSNASGPSPITTTTQPITYYVDALFPKENLLTNGDFSNGNNDFISGYKYTPTNVTEGEYFVAKDPRTWNIALDYCNDHTTGDGQMLIVNGSQTPGVVVWQQSISIEPNKDYVFATQLQAIWSPNPAVLQFYINGNPIGPSKKATTPACRWTEFYEIWNSGSNTTITLSIVDLNTSKVGNDFALDDILFAEVYPLSDSININVKYPYIKATGDTTVCEGTPVQLNVSKGTQFVWSPPTGLSDPGIPNPIATPADTTEYVVTGIDTQGCLARDTVLVKVKPAPAANVTNDTLVCQGSTVQLSASDGVAYQWSPDIDLNDPTIPNPVSTTKTDRTYEVRVTGANGCVKVDSVAIKIKRYPLFFARAAQPVCSGEQMLITASGGDTFLWTPSAPFPDPTQPSIVFIPTTTSVYTVSMRDTLCNHDTTISVTVVVNPNPVVTVQKSNDITCDVPTAILQASGGKFYSWAPSDFLTDTTGPNTITSTDTTIMYQVTGENEFGCTSSDTITVKASNTGVAKFSLPNAFTPNNDGKNDCFGILHWGNSVIEKFSIYNRWGALIFQTTDPLKCWDGKWNGKTQDAGGYIYIIKATTRCGEVTKKGMLMLIR